MLPIDHHWLNNNVNVKVDEAMNWAALEHIFPLLFIPPMSVGK